MQKLVELFRTDRPSFENKLREYINHISSDISSVGKLIDELTNMIYKDMFSYGKLGRLYCLHNEEYNYHGSNVYKLGSSKDLVSRMKGYVTPLLYDSEYKIRSNELPNCYLAEDILFHILEKHRITNRREFFDCELHKIAKTIADIEEMFIGNIPVVYVPRIVTDIKLQLTRLVERFITKQIKSKLKVMNDKLMIDEILNAIDIDESCYIHLLNKKITNQLTNEENSMLYKYEIKRDWKITNVNREFIEKYNGKTHIIYNLRLLLDCLKIDDYAKIHPEYFTTSIKTRKLEQITMLTEILTMLGFKRPSDGITLNKDTFLERIKNVVDKSKILNTDRRKSVFRIDIKQAKSITTIKQFMGFMNAILKDWGIMIAYAKKNRKKKIDGNWKNCTEYLYKLEYIGDISKYV